MTVGALDSLRLAITAGEPAGIGPDLCALLRWGDAGDALHALARQLACRLELVMMADAAVLTERADALGLRRQPTHPTAPVQWLTADCPRQAPTRPGSLNPENARYVLNTLTQACDACLRGECDAMVTAPVHKGVINDAGLPFSGHTEWLAERCQTPTPVMLLATPTLRVALATTHLALRDVADAITPTRLEAVVRTLHADLQRRFELDRPQILVCGLNPHAGEGGHLGREELDIIIPVLTQLRRLGMRLIGPTPADTAFTPDGLRGVQAVLAMYHDQGLPVLKHQGFGQAVNVTLGLPIIRTSVDHGTALPLAGTGNANPDSLLYAIEVAARMALSQRRRRCAHP